MRYMVTKEIKSETKIWAFFYWQDFLFFVMYVVMTLMLKDQVHSALGTPFLIFSILIAFMLILPSPTNPKRRTWQALVLYNMNHDYLYRLNGKGKVEQEYEQKETGKRHRRPNSNRRLR